MYIQFDWWKKVVNKHFLVQLYMWKLLTTWKIHDPQYCRYDPKTDQWTCIATISSPRDAVGVCVLGEKVFAVGGYDGQQYLQDVECYDPANNEWTKVWTAPANHIWFCPTSEKNIGFTWATHYLVYWVFWV